MNDFLQMVSVACGRANEPKRSFLSVRSQTSRHVLVEQRCYLSRNTRFCIFVRGDIPRSQHYSSASTS